MAVPSSAPANAPSTLPDDPDISPSSPPPCRTTMRKNAATLPDSTDAGESPDREASSTYPHPASQQRR